VDSIPTSPSPAATALWRVILRANLAVSGPISRFPLPEVLPRPFTSIPVSYTHLTLPTSDLV